MDKLITLYQKHLHLQSATFSRINHEDAMVAIVYKVEKPSGAQLILKISARPNDFLRELYFLKHLAGKLPVPRIIQVVQPEPDLHGAILMECLPGTLLKITDLTDALAYEMGSLLARIHLNRVTGYGDPIKLNDFNADPNTPLLKSLKKALQNAAIIYQKRFLSDATAIMKRTLTS